MTRDVECSNEHPKSFTTPKVVPGKGISYDGISFECGWHKEGPPSLFFSFVTDRILFLFMANYILRIGLEMTKLGTEAMML